MESISATLIHDADDGWTVVVPGAGQVTVADPRLADVECRQLLQRDRGTDWFAVEEFEIRLVDVAGAPLYVFDLLCTGF